MSREKIYPYNFKIKPNPGIEIKLPNIISFERYDINKRFNDYMIMNPQIQNIIKNCNSIENITNKLSETILELLERALNTDNNSSMAEYYTDQYKMENILKILDEYKEGNKND